MAPYWQMDQSGHVILFRLPTELQLDTLTSTTGKTNITDLPHDILLLIFDHLHLTDRVCLGLTCKQLALQVTCAPRIPLIHKVQATYPLAYHVVNGIYQPAQTRPTYISFTPEWYTLLPRLAKGWVPKDKFKYCWKCNKIYPREESYYGEALSKQKVRRWLWKLNVTEKQWKSMTLDQQHSHLITRWLTDDTRLQDSLHPPAPVADTYYPDLGIWAEPDRRGPECPLCLERELIYGWKGPKKFFDDGSSARIFLTNLAILAVDIGRVACNSMSRLLRSPC